MLCSGESEVPTVVVVIEGGYATLEAARDAVNANTPILVFAGSGKSADFIAAAYDRRSQSLVLQTLHNFCLTITTIYERKYLWEVTCYRLTLLHIYD